MALENNLYPDIQFEEINESPRPTQIGSTARIGVVGTFRKGPYKTFRLRSTFEEFAKMYGDTTHAGSVSVQAAMDQGADDFGIVRVMGSAKAGTLNVSFTVPSAPAVTAGNLELKFQRFQSNGITQIGVDAIVTIPVANAQTAAAIANAAVTAINSDTNVNTYITAVYVSGGTITLQADAPGNNTNYYKVTMSVPGVGGAGGVTPSPTVATFFSGGANGPTRSGYMVQDRQVVPADIFQVYAAYDGTWGDNVQITITNGSTATMFNIIATDVINGHQESYFDIDLSNELNIDDNTNEILATRASNIIRMFYVGAGTFTTELPEILTNQPLTGGGDGPPVEVQDYIDALQVMEVNQVNLILAAGQTDNTIRAALISQAETSDAITGYRIAVVNADKNMDIEALNGVSSPFNTNTGSAVMVAGWATYAGQPRLARFGCSPDGLYAGHLAVTDIQVSPAARASSPFIQNIVELDTVMTGQAFNNYTKARMEALVLDPATGGFHCLNGRTLSSDGAWYWVSIRRVYNQIKTDLFRSVQWVKSQPNTNPLRVQLAQQLDGYMGLLLSRGIIAATKSSLVDSTNNPPDRVASGYLRAEVYFVPVFPADHVVIGVRRYLAADVLV
jgi:phage tail sheath protein FI